MTRMAKAKRPRSTVPWHTTGHLHGQDATELVARSPSAKGPHGLVLPINDILVFKGAGFVVPVAGSIRLMPGTVSNPAFRRIDVDDDTGKVRGLF